MKKQGKVKAIPVTDPKPGMQVYPQGQIGKHLFCTIRAIEGDVIKLNRMDGVSLESRWNLSDLKQLAVEYKGFYQDSEGRMHVPVKVLPLKYSQWQAALDNGEIDADVEVTFEIIKMCKSPYCECDEITCTGGMPVVAKIIPAKKCRVDIAYKGGRLRFEGLSAVQAEALCDLADQAQLAGERRSAIIPSPEERLYHVQKVCGVVRLFAREVAYSLPLNTADRNYYIETWLNKMLGSDGPNLYTEVQVKNLVWKAINDAIGFESTSLSLMNADKREEWWEANKNIFDA